MNVINFTHITLPLAASAAVDLVTGRGVEMPDNMNNIYLDAELHEVIHPT